MRRTPFAEPGGATGVWEAPFLAQVHRPAPGEERTEAAGTERRHRCRFGPHSCAALQPSLHAEAEPKQKLQQAPTPHLLPTTQAFYEWRQEGKEKQPYHLHLAVRPTGGPPTPTAGSSGLLEGGPTLAHSASFLQEGQGEGAGGGLLPMAALWDSWEQRPADGPPLVLHTFTILTTDSPPWLTWLHDR